MSKIELEEIVEGEITGVEEYGVFLKLEDSYIGLAHISEIPNKYINSLNRKYKIGEKIKVKIISIDKEKHQVRLSIKKLHEPKIKKEIKEYGIGFEPLKTNLDVWISEKLKEIEKN